MVYIKDMPECSREFFQALYQCQEYTKGEIRRLISLALEGRIFYIGTFDIELIKREMLPYIMGNDE